MSPTYSFAKTNGQTLERGDEEVWALWEEVGSRGLDTWTGLPAMDAIPDGSGSEPGGSCYHTSLVENHLATARGRAGARLCLRRLSRMIGVRAHAAQTLKCSRGRLDEAGAGLWRWVLLGSRRR
jgi:hypothetical protein